MHARQIIQDFLALKCGTIHAKRREALAAVTDAARRSGLGLIKISKRLASDTALRHRIKRADRLLSNPHLERERHLIYKAMAHRLIGQQSGIGIIVDWSDLLPDISQQVLRAAVVVRGRAVVIYEEIHPLAELGTRRAHYQFMQTLRAILPVHCHPIILSDAGFRATWFKLLDELGFAWIGRIRNRDMVSPQDELAWRGCKSLYPSATSHPRDLGKYFYARANPVACRLVLIKRAPKGRKSVTVFGQSARSRHNQKHRTGQNEPWLLAASPSLSQLKARDIVNWYATRMQIEQTFRDLKNAQWGMGLSTSQTRNPKRLVILLLIGALVSLALWLIGLALKKSGYTVQYGSAKKAYNTLSVLSLARHWLEENPSGFLPRSHINQAAAELTAMLAQCQI